MDTWRIVRVEDPARIVANSDLFDAPVTSSGATDFLRRPGHLMFLAESGDGQGIGFVTGVEMRHPDKGAEMFVYELGVEEEWQRKGVARALLHALRAEGLRRGCVAMCTGTESDNAAAIATYRSVGAVVDDRSVFITWDDLDAPSPNANGSL